MKGLRVQTGESRLRTGVKAEPGDAVGTRTAGEATAGTEARAGSAGESAALLSASHQPAAPARPAARRSQPPACPRPDPYRLCWNPKSPPRRPRSQNPSLRFPDPIPETVSLPLTPTPVPATHLPSASSAEPRVGARGSCVDSKYKAKVQPTKTRSRRSRGRISAPAPGPAGCEEPGGSACTAPRAARARGPRSPTDRGGARAKPRPQAEGPPPGPDSAPRLRPRPGPDSAPGAEPRFQRKPSFWPLSAPLPLFPLLTRLSLSLSPLICRLPARAGGVQRRITSPAHSELAV